MLLGMRALVGPNKRSTQCADKAHTLRVPLLDRQVGVAP